MNKSTKETFLLKISLRVLGETRRFVNEMNSNGISSMSCFMKRGNCEYEPANFRAWPLLISIENTFEASIVPIIFGVFINEDAQIGRFSFKSGDKSVLIIDEWNGSPRPDDSCLIYPYSGLGVMFQVVRNKLEEITLEKAIEKSLRYIEIYKR